MASHLADRCMSASCMDPSSGQERPPQDDRAGVGAESEDGSGPMGLGRRTAGGGCPYMSLLRAKSKSGARSKSKGACCWSSHLSTGSGQALSRRTRLEWAPAKPRFLASLGMTGRNGMRWNQFVGGTPPYFWSQLSSSLTLILPCQGFLPRLWPSPGRISRALGMPNE